MGLRTSGTPYPVPVCSMGHWRCRQTKDGLPQEQELPASPSGSFPPPPQCPNAHRGTRGHPEQHRCKSRARLWGWHKGGCSAGHCGCTLSKQHLQGAPSIYPKRAVGLLLGRCAAGPCSPACCMPSPSSGMAPTPPSNRNTTLPQAVLSSPARGNPLAVLSAPKGVQSHMHSRGAALPSKQGFALFVT